MIAVQSIATPTHDSAISEPSLANPAEKQTYINHRIHNSSLKKTRVANGTLRFWRSGRKHPFVFEVRGTQSSDQGRDKDRCSILALIVFLFVGLLWRVVCVAGGMDWSGEEELTGWWVNVLRSLGLVFPAGEL